MLITRRKELSLTQSELASKLSRPQSFVSKYESGERKIDAVELIELIQCLDESPETFIKKYCSKLEKT
jgi:transcriptional regulator with XRE-family HTH domain